MFHVHRNETQGEAEETLGHRPHGFGVGDARDEGLPGLPRQRAAALVDDGARHEDGDARVLLEQLVDREQRRLTTTRSAHNQAFALVSLPSVFLQEWLRRVTLPWSWPCRRWFRRAGRLRRRPAVRAPARCTPPPGRRNLTHHVRGNVDSCSLTNSHEKAIKSQKDRNQLLKSQCVLAARKFEDTRKVRTDVSEVGSLDGRGDGQRSVGGTHRARHVALLTWSPEKTRITSARRSHQQAVCWDSVPQASFNLSAMLISQPTKLSCTENRSLFNKHQPTDRICCATEIEVRPMGKCGAHRFVA